MWKYVTRRIRDTFERNANHFDRRSTTVVNNAPSNITDDKNKHSCCKWFASKKCWRSSQNDNNTNGRKWKFEHLNKTWMGAITWSGALVLGWYTSQFMHLKLKHHLRATQKNCPSVNDLLTSLQPYLTCGNKDFYLNSASKIKNLVPEFIPTVHLVANGQDGNKIEKSVHSTTDSGSSENSDDDLGEVLNSIENKLGLAAIENGQFQDGLSLLRSAANRNHAPAIYNLGLCYENGLGVSANEKIAMELYRSAAALKHPGALYNLGIFYGQGRGGLKCNQETATRLLRLAAVQGQQDAIDALKSLDVPIAEPPRNDMNTWNYQPSPFLQNDNIVPTHINFFVDNFNYLQTQNCEAIF